MCALCSHNSLPANISCLAVQVLQIFSPLGHALGLSVASVRLEDLSFEVLFGESYRGMRAWMHGEQELSLIHI